MRAPHLPYNESDIKQKYNLNKYNIDKSNEEEQSPQLRRQPSAMRSERKIGRISDAVKTVVKLQKRGDGRRRNETIKE
jgi:hypothetical protein